MRACTPLLLPLTMREETEALLREGLELRERLELPLRLFARRLARRDARLRLRLPRLRRDLPELPELPLTMRAVALADERARELPPRLLLLPLLEVPLTIRACTLEEERCRSWFLLPLRLLR